MAQIASSPGGQIFLWIMTLGLVALGLWRLATTLMTTENKEKAKGAVLGIVFLALGFSSLTFARGSSSSDGQKSTSITSKILEMPGGKIIIVVGGLVIIGVGIYGIVKGATRKFVKDLEAGARAGNVGTGITVAGTAGYIACEIAFLILGSLVIWAGLSADARKAAGMDSALRTIGEQPFDAILLILIAFGFMLYGLYSIARAKYTNEI